MGMFVVQFGIVDVICFHWFNLGFVGGIWARHLILIFWNSLEHKCLWFEYVSCNLWALGLPYGPLRNYNALAVGFDYSAGN